MQAPANVVGSDEAGVVIPFTALDQNGAAVTDYSTLVAATSLSPSPAATDAASIKASGRLHWVQDYVHNVAELEYDAPHVTTDTPVTLMIVSINGSGTVDTDDSYN